VRGVGLFVGFAMLGASQMLTAKPPPSASEDEATGLVMKAMRHISPHQAAQCLSYMVEDRSPDWFDVAVREKHGGSCPGDPAVAPVVERFRVGRSPLALGRWDPVNDAYAACEIQPNGDPACPRLSFE
jgi:hypothetical protein